MESRDAEIRHYFHLKKLRSYHSCPDTLVIDELGVSHGKIRVDIAVLNGKMHAYEIKSSKDTLARLPEQINEYSRCFEKVSIVSAPNHVENVLAVVPEWCGLILATKGTKGAISFRTLRRAKRNPNVELYAMAHLLWRREIIDILSRLGVADYNLKAPREKLYSMLPASVSTGDLTQWIKEKFISRTEWRADALQK